jgi:hypothetical protein
VEQHQTQGQLQELGEYQEEGRPFTEVCFIPKNCPFPVVCPTFELVRFLEGFFLFTGEIKPILDNTGAESENFVEPDKIPETDCLVVEKQRNMIELIQNQENLMILAGNRFLTHLSQNLDLTGITLAFLLVPAAEITDMLGVRIDFIKALRAPVPTDESRMVLLI